MPLINVNYASELADHTKAELIAELTKTYARVTGASESSVWVMLNQVPRTDWGVGGTTLAARDAAPTQVLTKPEEDPEHDPTLALRQAADTDLERLADIETECFPPAEAASLTDLTARYKVFGDHFWY